MSDLVQMNSGQRMALTHAARDLHTKFEGVFGQETIEALLFDSFRTLAARATVTDWLVIGAENFARQRLEALVQADDHSTKKLPAVLFLCVHNSGRSQMALGWFTHFAGDRAIAWSGGSEPGSQVNTNVVAAMAEIDIDISREFPKPWVDEFLQAADVVITMGCGDACPLFPGKHYEDWELDDPSGKTVAEIRPIRDEIGHRVNDLLERMAVTSGNR